MTEGSGEGYIPKPDIQPATPKRTTYRIIQTAIHTLNKLFPQLNVMQEVTTSQSASRAKTVLEQLAQGKEATMAAEEVTPDPLEHADEVRSHAEVTTHAFPLVSEIARSKNIFFVHGTSAAFESHPEPNSLLHGNPSLQERLEIARRFRPTLSASSLQEEDGRQNMWRGVGLLIADGEITSANPKDANTRPSGFYTRSDKTSVNHASIIAQIDAAIRDRGKSGKPYNEFTIKDPQFGGIYVSIDASQMPLPPVSELLKIADEMKMPLYVVLQGELYTKPSITASELGMLFSRGNDVLTRSNLDALGFTKKSPEDVQPVSTSSLTNEEKATEATRLSSLFQLENFSGIPDAISYVRYMDGIDEYIKTHVKEVNNKCLDNPSLLEPANSDGFRRIPSLRTYYYQYALDARGKLYREYNGNFYEIQQDDSVSTDFLRYEISGRYGSKERNDALLNLAERIITVSTSPAERRRVLLGLYGYADMEAKFGDIQYAEQLQAYVEKIVPRREMQTFLE